MANTEILEQMASQLEQRRDEAGERLDALMASLSEPVPVAEPNQTFPFVDRLLAWLDTPLTNAAYLLGIGLIAWFIVKAAERAKRN